MANLARNKLLSKIAILGWNELPSGSAYLYPLIIEAGQMTCLKQTLNIKMVKGK